MARYDFRSPRLFVAPTLRSGATVPLDAAQGHYLTGVLRLQAGDCVLVFNGRDGEWQSRLAGTGKRAELGIDHQVRPQSRPGDLHYLFSPLKRARLDYMVQKAVEMGVSRLQPVMTRRTQAERVNLDRMHANAIEAAEQCGILRIPELHAPEKLERVVAGWDAARSLIFCDEGSDSSDPLAALAKVRPGPLALLIGPEGGFDDAERELLSCKPFVARISLGPRILRADTAAVAALALVNAALGDWR
jgi:16S rRNA (uracil1498-N3)-methyltransferase